MPETSTTTMSAGTPPAPVDEYPSDRNYAERFFPSASPKDDSETAEERKLITILPANDDIPFKRIQFTKDLQNLMEDPWKNAIIFKILGRPWIYPALKTKLDTLWDLGGRFDLLDLGHNCFCLKTLSIEKRDFILTEGPWQIAGSFLAIRKWTPKFRSDLEKMDYAISWVRVLNLPLEMFRESVIQTMASCIGEPIKIDGNTFNASRGKYARFCVQLRTDTPLERGLCINDDIYQVVYENLPSLCYSCGRVGHTKQACPSTPATPTENQVRNNLTEANPPRFNLTGEKEFPSISESRTRLNPCERRIRIDLHTPSKPKSEDVQRSCPVKLEAPTSNSNQNDIDLPTSSGKRNSSSPVNYKLRSTDNGHRGKRFSRNPKHHYTLHELNQNETDLPTCFGKSRSSSPTYPKSRNTNNERRGNNLSPGNTKFFNNHHDHQEVKRASRSSFDTSIDEPFDICLPETRRSGSKIFVNKDNGNKVDETKVLRPGMILFKHYLSPSEQVHIVSKCRELGLGPGGFYRPGYNDGAKLRLYMMCLGLDWNPQTKRYAQTRHHDNAAPPGIPEEFTSLVCRALDDSQTLIKSYSEAGNVEDELPLMSPDVCIVNFYTTNGRLGLHQDRDESKESLSKGLPVVSISVGDSAEFLYGDDRDVDKAECVLLESGDVLIFGGDSRHIFHGVKTIHPNTAPAALLKETNLGPGLLNLTFRKY